MDKIKSRTFWLVLGSICLITAVQVFVGDKSTLPSCNLTVVALVGVFAGKSTIKGVKGNK